MVRCMAEDLKCPMCASTDVEARDRKDNYFCKGCRKIFKKSFVQNPITLREGVENVREFNKD